MVHLPGSLLLSTSMCPFVVTLAWWWSLRLCFLLCFYYVCEYVCFIFLSHFSPRAVWSNSIWYPSGRLMGYVTPADRNSSELTLHQVNRNRACLGGAILLLLFWFHSFNPRCWKRKTVALWVFFDRVNILYVLISHSMFMCVCVCARAVLFWWMISIPTRSLVPGSVEPKITPHQLGSFVHTDARR